MAGIGAYSKTYNKFATAWVHLLWYLLACYGILYHVQLLICQSSVPVTLYQIAIGAELLSYRIGV